MTHLKGISLLSLAIVLAAPAVAQAQPKPVAGSAMRFDIAPSDLRTALSQFSRVSGMQVVAAPSVVAGHRTGGVRGAFTSQAALDQLLRGTSLIVAMRGNVAVLKRAPKAAPSRPVVIAATTPVVQNAPSYQSETDAQEPATDIVVTGYRQSLAEAQQLKRSAVGAEDDIVATDIAAFPDLNLAESLQRIPGITITRDSGEGRQIALRGLGADFTRTQLNGMEVLGNTASGMDNRGNVSRTRSFDYSLFASELFNRVAVQKSFSAEQDEGGIAGTVQLTTARPFDYAGSKFVISAKGQTNTNTSGVTPRLVGLASGRWGDFGVLVSAAYSNIRSNEYGYRNWGWGSPNTMPPISAPGSTRRPAPT